MNPYEFFEEEYNNLQVTVSDIHNLISQTKNFYFTINNFQQHIVSSKENLDNKDKINLTIGLFDDLIDNLKDIITTAEATQQSLRKAKHV